MVMVMTIANNELLPNKHQAMCWAIYKSRGAVF
jgi:hypothetical protein